MTDGISTPTGATEEPEATRDPLEVKVEEMEHRIEVLLRQRRPLADRAERRHQASQVVRSEIRSVMATHTGPDRLTAKRVAKLLGCEPAPSIRTIQDHMRAISAASSVPRS